MKSVNDKEAQRYREAADTIWELAKKYPTKSEIAEELRAISTDLHAKAAMRSTLKK